MFAHLKAVIRSFARRCVLFSVKLAFTCGLAWSALVFSGFAPVSIKEIRVPVEVEAPEPTIEQVLDEAPRLGMPKEIAAVFLEQEDAGRYRKNAKRCEWESKEWLDRATKIEPRDKEQRDAYRCSYGPFQVAGWHAPNYGMVWSDLLNMRNNLEVAVAVWGKCMEEAKRAKDKRGLPLYSDKRGVYWHGFRCYNGTGQDAIAYADRAMARLERIAVNRMLASFNS